MRRSFPRRGLVAWARDLTGWAVACAVGMIIAVLVGALRAAAGIVSLPGASRRAPPGRLRPYAGVRASRARRRVAALESQVERLRPLAVGFDEIEAEASAVREAWARADQGRAAQFDRWVEEAAELAFDEGRWISLALRWREGAFREGGGDPPPLAAWLAAQLMAQIEEGRAALSRLEAELAQERERAAAEGWLDVGRELVEPVRSAGAWAVQGRTVAALAGCGLLAAPAALAVGADPLLSSLGWASLSLLLLLGAGWAAGELGRDRGETPPRPPEPVRRRLVPYLGEEVVQDRSGDSSSSSRQGAFRPSAAPPASVRWGTLLVLLGGLGAVVVAGYDRWSQAGSLDAPALASLMSGIYAGAAAVGRAADRLARGPWLLRESLGLGAGAAAIAATLAVSLVEFHRFDDARALRGRDAVHIGGSAFRSFFQQRTRVPVTWRAAAGGDGISFDVRVRAAPPFRRLGPPRIWVVGTKRRRAVWRGRPGHTYCFAARARSARYGSSPWSRERCLAVPLDDRALGRRGRWRSGAAAGYLLGTFTETRSQGAALVRPVTARRLTLLAERCRGCGTVEVYLDRRRIGRLSLSARSGRGSAALRIAAWASPRGGLVQVVVRSQGRRVRIDGLGASLLRP